MAKIIHADKKKEMLSFISDNFGKISQREIARRLNVGKTTINCWAMELGFKHQKYTVNEDFFDDLTEESAYILGFIYADGNVSWNTIKGYYSLTITAAAKDKEHLELFRVKLNSTKPLLYSQKTNSYRLIANSKKLCEKLINLGVIPKKSMVVTFPNFIPKKLMKHFLRGIIDGDGCIRWVKRDRSPFFEITIASGSRKFSEGFVKAINNNIEVTTNLIKRDNIFIMRYTCTRAEKLARYIYSNGNIFLKRKNKKFLECLEARHNGK